MKKKFVGVFINPGLDRDTVEKNTNKVLSQLSNTLLNKLDAKLTTKILYWLNSWGIEYLPNEKSFNPLSILNYERGNIIEVDLGFKIGSEQGGLHYAVVLDNQNKKSSPVLMIVPLKSMDKGENIDEDIEVLINENIFELEKQKYIKKLEDINKKILEPDNDKSKLLKLKTAYEKDIENFSNKTIAQPSQMCALSKMRIYFPTNTSDKLYQLKMPEEYMEKIEGKIKELYF